MTADDVIARYPTLGNALAHPTRVSHKFAPIGTADTLRQLETEGFRIHGVQVQRVSAESGRYGFEKHELRLRKPGAAPLTKLGDVFPEVILRNANDGTSAWQISAGMLRLVCLNGMTVGSTWGAIRVSHLGKATASKVIEASFSIVNSFGKLAESIDTWRGLELSSEEQHAFAEQAFRLRYSVDAETGTTRAPVTPYAMLTTRRFGDAGNDLWTVFNRVQENVTRGGIAGRTIGSNGRERRASTRALTGIDQTMRMNRKLFDLAESWAGNKAAPRVPELAAFSRDASDAEVIAAA